MSEEQTSQDLKNTEETPEINLQNLKDVLKNKQKIRLLFPYDKNQEVKKLGAKYDNVNKYWYYPSLNSNFIDELKQYEAHQVHIEYDDILFFQTRIFVDEI